MVGLARALVVGDAAAEWREAGSNDEISLADKLSSIVVIGVGTPGFAARAVREGDWKLIVHGIKEPAKIELFNLATDPNEATNLAPQMPDKVAALQRKLAEFAAADRE